MTDRKPLGIINIAVLEYSNYQEFYSTGLELSPKNSCFCEYFKWKWNYTWEWPIPSFSPLPPPHSPDTPPPFSPQAFLFLILGQNKRMKRCKKEEKKKPDNNWIFQQKLSGALARDNLNFSLLRWSIHW